MLSVLYTVRCLNFRRPNKFAVICLKNQPKRPNLRIFRHKDANGIANSEDLDQTDCSSKSSLIWVCTGCSDLFVQKLRIIMVPNHSIPRQVSGSLPVFSAHSFISNSQLAHLESTEKGEKSPCSNKPDVWVNLRQACI